MELKSCKENGAEKRTYVWFALEPQVFSGHSFNAIQMDVQNASPPDILDYAIWPYTFDFGSYPFRPRVSVCCAEEACKEH